MTRRSNHEGRLRGAFTNPAVINLAVRDRQGPGGHAYTADRMHVLPVHQAAPTYWESDHAEHSHHTER